MFGFRSLLSAVFELRNQFAGRKNDAIQFFILSYNKKHDRLRTWYFTNMKTVSPLSEDELILVCYYAPCGDWDRYYGDEFCWNLTYRRIALDILNNTLIYNKDFSVNGRDILPSWLRSDIDSCFNLY